MSSLIKHTIESDTVHASSDSPSSNPPEESDRKVAQVSELAIDGQILAIVGFGLESNQSGLPHIERRNGTLNDVKIAAEALENQSNMSSLDKGWQYFELSHDAWRIYHGNDDEDDEDDKDDKDNKDNKDNKDDEEKCTVEEAIRLARKSLLLIPVDDQKRVLVHYALARYLYLDHELDDGGDHESASLVESAKLFRLVYELLPQDHILRERSLVQCAVALNDLYSFAGDTTVFNEAIVIALERLALHAGTDKLEGSLSAVSDLWRSRYHHSDERTAMDSAVSYARQRLDLHPVGHPARGPSLTALAGHLGTLASDLSLADMMEEALQYYQQALPLFPVEHKGHQDLILAYAGALSDYSEITDNSSGLQLSVDLYEELLKAQMPGSDGRVDTLERYAMTLDNLYLETGDELHLTRAISLYHEAMDYYSHDDTDANMLFMNIGIAYLTYFDESENPTDLEESLRLLRHALSLTAKPDMERVRILANLGGALLKCHYNEVGEYHNGKFVEEAHCAFKEAITLIHPDHPLSMDCHARLSECYASSYFSYQDLEKAAKHLLHAIAMPSSPPSDRLNYCWSAMEELHEALELEDLATISATLVTAITEIYQHLMSLLPRVAHFGQDLDDRLYSLTEADDIGIVTSWHTLQLSGGDIGLALEHLEAARGVFWTQALNLRSAKPESLPNHVADELQQLLIELEHGTYIDRPSKQADKILNSFDNEAVVKRQKAARVDEILWGIRQQPGLERFMMGPNSASLSSAVSVGYVVILIPGIVKGSEAIILQPGLNCGATKLTLEVTEEELEDWAIALQESQSRSRSSRLTGNNRLSLSKTLPNSKARKGANNQVLSDIWSTIVQPVLHALKLQPTTGRSRPRLHWCPTGLFTFLPLHAAGVYQGPPSARTHTFDYIVSSYTPTLAALLKAQASFSDISLKTSTALLVAEGASPGMAPLPNVKEESYVVRDLLLKAQIQAYLSCTAENNQLNIKAVTSRLADASIAHFACHGVQDAENALDSGFCLRDGVLTVAELMRLNLSEAVFAFLSACETAQGDRDQPDQTIHLCAALLFCGFKSIIGTMWGMSDEDGPIVAAAVYKELCAKDTITADDIAYALDSAVGELRARNAGPDRWAPFVHIGA